jgi:hypothetical protein
VRRTITLLLLSLPLGAAAGEPQGESEKHWSFQKRTRPEVPQFRDAAGRAWVRTPVDAFLLARLRKEGLRPAPEADRPTLIRRLAFDLTGLPPTPAEVAAFVNDSSPDAYEKLVERLLASPHHGEQWGRHWLDVVRFAETDGFEYDRYRPGAYSYRDYVIRSFNGDKPYDQFLREQLAGDEIEPHSREMQVAAGFHRLGPVRRNAGNGEVAFSRHEVLTERTDALGVALLGVTVGCARCHDHKFDDISQADYYRLQAFLASSHEYDVMLVDARTEAEWKARTGEVQAEITKIKRAMRGLRGDARRDMERRLEQAERKLPPPLPAISSVRDMEDRRTPVHILKRGNTENKGRQVGMRVPSALLPEGAPELPPDTPKPRTVLAKWVTDPDNPLTARVMVNRIWQYHFGKGLVVTANDFGVNGGRPSHPELLDYLANEFVASGFRIKPIHRLIVLSSAYRQSSSIADCGLRIADSRGGNLQSAIRNPQSVDPDDRLLFCFPRRRLEAEEIRDGMLSVSGRLNPTAGGPSVIVPVEQDLVKLLYNPKQWAVTADVREHDRRSVYLIAKRNLRLPFAEVFDQPDLQTSCPRREASTHALQALELLNGTLANRLAEEFARRLEQEAGPDPARQVGLAYRLAAGREPTARETELALAFLARQPLKEFALAVFNLNAFLYVN